MPDSELTPHGALLEAARGGTSKREAARRADISEGRWRQIVTGVQRVGGGRTLPVNPRRETLVAMAQAVGADVAAVLSAAGLSGSYEEVTPTASSSDVDVFSIEDDVEAMQEFLRQRAARRGRLSAADLRRRQDELEAGPQDDRTDVEPR